MQDTPFNRRHWMASAALGSLTLGSGCAAPPGNPASPGTPPTQWTDEHGLVAALPKDADALTNELAKYPRCRYCGMERAKFSHTRHLLIYEDDSVEGTCSIHCAAISLALNMDRGPKALYAGDAGSKEAIKPLVPVDQAHYVLDPSKPGTMTRASKFAYASRAAAEAAAASEAAVRAGARIVDFNAALTAAYLGMAEDTVMLRKRRGELRRKLKMGA
jgi:nitrous oxide reductase accessory protein NosL